MPAPSGKRALPAALIAGQLPDPSAQGVDTLPRRGRQPHLAGPQSGLVAAQVDLVVDDRDWRSLGQLLAQRRLDVGGILDPEYGVGARQRLARAPDAFRLDAVRVVANSSRVHKLDGKPFDVDLLAQDIARRAGHLGDDRRFLPAEQIQQARLAGVRLADDDDLETVSQDAALTRLVAQGFEGGGALVDTTLQRIVRQEIDFLLGKVDGRLDVHAQSHELLGQRLDGARKCAGQRAQRGAGRLRGAAADEVGNRLRLHEIELAVEERAF